MFLFVMYRYILTVITGSLTEELRFSLISKQIYGRLFAVVLSCLCVQL